MLLPRGHRYLAPFLLAAIGGARTHADVAVSLQAETAVAQVGQTVGVRVQLSADHPAPITAADILFGWDPAELRLLGVSNEGAVPLLTSGLPRPDPYGLNEAAIPADGDAMYIAFARLGSPLIISEEGGSTLLTTLLFETLTPTNAAEISILPSAGSPLGHTVVYDGATPNTNVTGSLSSTSVRIIPAPGAALALLVGVSLTRRRRPHA